MRTAAALLLLLTTCATLRGQATTTTATADQGIRLQTYALGSYQQPNFSSYADHQAGATVGGDLNLFHFGRFQPSVDARTSANFGAVSSLFAGGGPRVVFDAGRFHPYVNFLAGYGTLHFTTGTAYTHDNSFVTALGGGADISLNHRWAIRADLQRQSWLVDSRSAAFHPVQLGIGIRYQFHFHNKNGPE